MKRRVIAIFGTATAAALGAWLAVRSRASRDNVGDLSASLAQASRLPALGQFPMFEIDDDRAAEIIEHLAPALEAVVREQAGSAAVV
jgi:hypothetical protein